MESLPDEIEYRLEERLIDKVANGCVYEALAAYHLCLYSFLTAEPGRRKRFYEDIVRRYRRAIIAKAYAEGSPEVVLVLEPKHLFTAHTDRAIKEIITDEASKRERQARACQAQPGPKG